jgi:pimeloyl-ACP methyl ester carboxylesterase
LCIDEWAAIGHSEGGLTAWATNEREAKYPSGGFLGSVSLAPSMDPLEINLRAFATEESRAALQASGSVFYPVFFLEVIRRLFPTLQLSDYLTPTGLSLLNLNLEGGCYAGAATFFPTFGLTEVWKDYSWLNSTEARQWAELVRDSGKDKLAKPLLLIQGSEDEAVSAPVNYDTFEKHCKMFEDSPIQLSIYPGYRHGPVVNAAIQEWSAFLDDLFEHKKPRNFGSCKRVTLEPYIDGGENMEELYSVRWAPPPSQS